MKLSEIVDQFVRYCLKYPTLTVESVFNRYMKLLNEKEIETITPYFGFMLQCGESARSSDLFMKAKMLKN